MISEREFHEILKEKGVIDRCRMVWWKSFISCSPKFDIDKVSLKNLVTVITKKGCKASCCS